MSDRNDLPQPSAPNFQQRLRETVQTYLGRQGDPLDRGLTLRDLIENGILKIKDGMSLTNGSGVPPVSAGDNIGSEPADLSPPPMPEGFTASPAISHVMIEHIKPAYTQGHGHFRTHVYGAKVTTTTLPTFDKAVELGQFSGTVWAMPSNPSTTWRLWIKWETVDGVLSTSPAGGTNGVEAITGSDVSSLVKAMTGEGNPFKVVSAPITLSDGTKVPVGVYMSDAFIHRMQVTNAMIANLAVDNAKIADLSVDKLRTGSVQVGQTISSANYSPNLSGWSINGAGQAEFQNAIVRGAIYANTGTFAGALAGATGTFSGDVKAGQFMTGGFTSSAWPTNNTGGVYLGPAGLKIKGAYPNTGNTFEIDAAGNVYAPQFSIVNGSATFSGNLAANIVTAENIISSSATNFQQSNISVGNGSWQSVSFYMDHAGIVAVIASISFNFSGTSANYSVRVGINYQGGDGSDGYYYSSAGPPSIGVQTSSWLSVGWHTIWVYANHTAATSSHVAYLTILRSYR